MTAATIYATISVYDGDRIVSKFRYIGTIARYIQCNFVVKRAQNSAHASRWNFAARVFVHFRFTRFRLSAGEITAHIFRDHNLLDVFILHGIKSNDGYIGCFEKLNPVMKLFLSNNVQSDGVIETVM